MSRNIKLFFFFILSININIFCQPINNCEKYTKYNIVTKPNGFSYIFNVFDSENNKDIATFEVKNCNFSNIEYHYPNLYVVRTSYGLKELWLYSTFESYKIDDLIDFPFTVNNTQNLIAYFKKSNKFQLVVKDLNRNIETPVVLDSLPTQYISELISSLKWSTNYNILWGFVGKGGSNSSYFFSYDYDKGVLTKYKVPLSLGDKFDLNPDLGLLLYSDFVYEFYDTESGIGPDIETTLFMYDFYKKTLKKIVSVMSNSNFLEISWICSDYYKYALPNDNKLIIIKN